MRAGEKVTSFTFFNGHSSEKKNFKIRNSETLRF